MKKIKKLMATALALLFLLSAFTMFASASRPANVQSWWLVGRNGNLTWSGSTRYQSYFDFAVTAWNNHRNVIRRTTLFTSTDVIIADDTIPNGSWVGITIERAFAGNGGINVGRIWFNEWWLFKTPQAGRRMVAMHELGHALGVCHIPGSNIMQDRVPVPAPTALSANDRAAANRAWNYHR